jgi:UDP-glucose 4-epimerase
MAEIKLKKNTVLITGGCGFIGTSLIAKLLENEPRTGIRVLDNFSVGKPEDLDGITPYKLVKPDECASTDGVTIIKGDIRDQADTLKCAEGVDSIIHLAANTGVGPSIEDPRLDMESNVIGTFNMLESARVNGVNKFVFASSGAPIGEVEPPIHEELAPHPVSPYGASKLAGEGYCSAYNRTFGVNTICLRFGNVYGPRSKKKSSVVAKFIREALNGEPCVIYGDGSQTRDFIYIEDLVSAIIMSIGKDVGGEIFQIATGAESTVGEVSQIISQTLEKRGIKMNITHDSPRLGDVKRNFSDTRKAEKLLGWSYSTALEQGIDNTVDYFLK